MAMPDLAAFRHHVEYQRDVSHRDDWQPGHDQWQGIATGMVSLEGRTGAEVEVADGIDAVQTYESWDRWQPGITTEDRVKVADGRILQIRSRVDDKGMGKWARMVLVENKTRGQGP